MSRRPTMVVIVGLFLALAVGGVLSTSVGAASSTTVRFASDTVTVNEDGTAKATVVVANADGGIGSANLSVTSGTREIAEIERGRVLNTDVSYQQGFSSLGNYTLDSDDVGISGDGEVALVEVTVRGDEPGTVPLDLTVHSLRDRNGNAYDVTSVGDATVTVEQPSPGARLILRQRGGAHARTQIAGPGQHTQWELLVADVDESLDTAAFTIRVENESVATFTDGDLDGAPASAVTVAEDGNSLTFDGTGMNVSADYTVAVAEFNVTADVVGATELILTVDEFRNAAGESYRITDTDGGTLDVLPWGENVSVRIEPSEREVAAGEQPTFDIVADGLPDGVDGFSVSITVEDRRREEFRDFPDADSVMRSGYRFYSSGDTYGLRSRSRAESLDGAVTLVRWTFESRETADTVEPSLDVAWIRDYEGRLYRVNGSPSGAGSGESVDDQDAATSAMGSRERADGGEDSSPTSTTGPLAIPLTVVGVLLAVAHLAWRRR